MTRPGWPLAAADGRPFHVVKLERDEARLIGLLAFIILATGAGPCA